MKKYSQTKQAKEEFKSPILDYMMKYPNQFISKDTFRILFNMSERQVRAEIERIANYYPIRATAGRKGYALIWWDDSSTLEELNSARSHCAAQIKEIENRIQSLNARLKPLIANIAVINDRIDKDLED